MKVSTNYHELVSTLKHRVEVIEDKGLNMIMKKIPDSDAVGDLDPRVYELAMEQKNRPPINIDINNLDINKLRAGMGFDNIDVTSIKIETTNKIIEGRNGEIPIRIYTPFIIQSMPAIIFFHGGAFIGGSLKTVENFCKCLAERAESVVVSVDYRLAPENKFPKGFHDCYDAVMWVYEHAKELHVNPEQLAVSGDSAGGNLSAVCSLIDRELGNNIIKHQSLIYPGVVLGREPNEYFTWDLEEYTIQHNHALIENKLTFMLKMPDISESYLENAEDIRNPYVSPLLADDLSNLPETVVITAEYDYLRVQGEAFARRLQQSDVKVKTIRYNGMDHAFIDKIGIFPQAEDCANEIAQSLIELFKHK